MAAGIEMPAAREQASALLDRAIAAAGGAEVLSRYRAMSWNGSAVVRVPGRVVSLVGSWKIEPPEKAIVETREFGGPLEDARTLVINGQAGWSLRDGEWMPLRGPVVANERDQFYLYSLMRLLPLRDPGVELEYLPAGADQLEGLRGTAPARPVVELRFDTAARLRFLTFSTLDPVTNKNQRQNVRLEGDVEHRGVRWFKRMNISWENQPYFELEISKFEVLPELIDARLNRPPQ